MEKEYILVNSNDKILYSPVEEFNFVNPSIDPKELYTILGKCIQSTQAMGVAANQLGINTRCFAIRSDPVKAFFNPNIVDIYGEEIVLEEGCLSFPNMFVKVKRQRALKIRYKDELGDVYTENFDGMTARVILHEYDHLEGITFKDRSNRFHWNQALNKKKKLDRQQKNGSSTNLQRL